MWPRWFLIKKILTPTKSEHLRRDNKKIEARKPWHGILSLILCTILVPLHHQIQFLISCLHLIVDSTLKLKKLNTVLNKQLKWWIINTKHPTHNTCSPPLNRYEHTLLTPSKKSQLVL